MSTESTTSAILRSGWKHLTAYSQEQDSQVIHEDAIVPGATYLGYARADHWAIALPLEHVKRHYPGTPDRIVRRINQLVDRNHYPRAALVEAALSYVANDLGLTRRTEQGDSGESPRQSRAACATGAPDRSDGPFAQTSATCGRAGSVPGS